MVAMNFSEELAANTQTIGEVSPGSPVTSQLDSPTDVDWFRIELVEGVRYQLDLTGFGSSNSLSDPQLRLFRDGEVIAEDNDDGPGLDPRIILTAPTSGTYYIEAQSPASQTGQYQLTVENLSQAAPPQQTNSIIDAIDWGTTVETNSINVYFAEQGESFAGHPSFGWTEYEIAQAFAALDEFEAVTNLTFNRVSSPENADFKLVMGSPIFFSAAMFCFACGWWSGPRRSRIPNSNP